ncbi:MAG: FAD-dependent thymidylate synthase [Candidatus Eisenbacteria bacterium]
MEVLLAGHNIDRALIAELGRAGGAHAGATDPPAIDPDSLTPETLSAAYARISRDPRPIPQLREEARNDVARARRSNRQIVFGFGHASVAEHAVFNLDILGISRLAVEALEGSRLGSYTEKSQRYILLERDTILPPEIAGGPLEGDFRRLIEMQQAGYLAAYERLSAHYAETRPQQWADDGGRLDLEGAAREDARYFLGLATTGQLGATLNARALEATVRRLAADPLEEVRELAKRLHDAVAPIAPSLLRYTSASPYRAETKEALRDRLRRICPEAVGSDVQSAAGDSAHPGGNAVPVRLLDPIAGEADLLAALIHGCAEISWSEAQRHVARLDPAARETLITESLARLSPHEPPLRAFEMIDLAYELILSASCFAQLKRHRLATLLPQPYQPALGVTVPPSFAQAHLTSLYAETCRAAESLFARVHALHPPAAAYALTNGHRRRLLFKVNARELYHIARLRLDEHAQWDIRALAGEMIRQARERLPRVMMFACGRDELLRSPHGRSGSTP